MCIVAKWLSINMIQCTYTADYCGRFFFSFELIIMPIFCLFVWNGRDKSTIFPSFSVFCNVFSNQEITPRYDSFSLVVSQRNQHTAAN